MRLPSQRQTISHQFVTTAVLLCANCLVWCLDGKVLCAQSGSPTVGDTAARLRPCQFKGVTPGESTADDALRLLGTPDADEVSPGSRTLHYPVEPFELVEIHVTGDVVSTVVLRFRTPVSPTQIEYELELQDIEATPVHDDSGKLLGRAYPERGVLMSFAPDLTAHRVSQLLLEPISAEPFRLRVQNDTKHHYQKNLEDLEIARQLAPGEAETLRLLATVSAKAGEVRQARRYLDEAAQLLPGNAQLTLDRIELLVRLDQLDEALTKAQGVVSDRHDDPEIQARAEKLLGDLVAMGARPNYETAIKHHLAAVKLLAPLANDSHASRRRAAKELLIETFLAIALDIASGEWQKQEATTEKWLASARELAESMVARDHADEFWRLRVALASLSVRAALPASQPVDDQIAAVTRMIQELGEASGDPLFCRELELLRVQALFDAASIAHRRGQSAQAVELAGQGVRLIEPLMDARHLLPMERYLFGRLYFFVGSEIAVSERDHERAVRAYAKAREFFSSTPPSVAARDAGKHGERWVSMGASYFESGNRELGVRLTRQGLEEVKSAAAAGLATETALPVAYANLAAMYKVIGNEPESRQFSEMAARAEITGQPTQRR